MPSQIALPYTFTNDTVAYAAQVNADLEEIRDKFNAIFTSAGKYTAPLLVPSSVPVTSHQAPTNIIASGTTIFEVDTSGNVLLGPNVKMTSRTIAAGADNLIPDFFYEADTRQLNIRTVSCNQINDPVDIVLGRAGCATTYLDGDATLPAGTIVVTATGTAFPSSGTLLISGQTVTYTGKTATSFTGCSGGTGTISSGTKVELPNFPDGDPVGLLNGPNIGQITWRAWCTPAAGTGGLTAGGAWHDACAQIYVLTTEDQFEGANGGEMYFLTNANSSGTTPTKRLAIRNGGEIDILGAKLRFGASQDCVLERTGAGALKLTATALASTAAAAAFSVDGLTATTDQAFRAKVAADTTYRISITPGMITFGAGGASALDTNANLYRSGSAEIRTDGKLIAGGVFSASKAAAGVVVIGASGPSSEAAVIFGDATDTNLYRSAADTLKTDDKLIVAGELNPLGALNHDGTTVGFYGVTPATRPTAYTQTYATADKTLNAYTSDPESSAYTGIDNAQGATPYAQVSDLNALRTAYETLRVFTEDAVAMLNSVVDDMQTLGLVS